MDTKNRWPEIEEVQALFLQQYEWAAEVRVGPDLKPLPEPAVPQIAAFLTLGVLFRSVGFTLGRELARAPETRP